MEKDREAVGQNDDQAQPEAQHGETDSGTEQAPEPITQGAAAAEQQPTDRQPEEAESTVGEPEGTEPAVVQPEDAKPTVVQPEEAEPAVGEPEAAEPAAAEPAQEETEAQASRPAEEQPKPAARGEERDEAGPQSIEDLKPGMQVKGKVRNIVEFGAFVDVGVGRDGLAHISTLKRAGIDKDLKVGDEIDVVVRRVDLASNRISLTVPRAERAVKSALRDLEVGSVVTGRVMRLVDFGAFVDIGAPTDGLLHVSQLSGGFVNHPSEALRVGEELQVRILDVDPERRRISLSLKDVEPEQHQAPEPEQPSQQEPSNGAPTAFEVAFQQALAERRRRRRRE